MRSSFNCLFVFTIFLRDFLVISKDTKNAQQLRFDLPILIEIAQALVLKFSDTIQSKNLVQVLNSKLTKAKTGSPFENFKRGYWAGSF